METMPIVRQTIYTKYIKRLFDIVLSCIAIIILSPIFLVIAVLELGFHGRPILYTQERTGVHGEIFKVYKFRSMTNDTDENGELLPANQRVTPFGRCIRRLSLDELPQLFCILIGKMSIIGPRPLLPRYLSYYTKRHMMRHEVKPGLACVPLKRMKTWTWREQFENDIWYIENCSFLVDLKEIFAVLREAAEGAEYRVNAKRERLLPDYWKI